MTIDELIAVLELQEEILQFAHFTNEDAWEVGNMLVAEAKRRGLSVAVSIRLNNGYTVFQYAGDSTNLNNENWMRRKQNMVKIMEHSSLHTYMMLQKTEESLEDWALNKQDYAACGGGFPVKVEEVGTIGQILVSGLDHVSDHDLIVKVLSRYLHIDEVPRIKTSLF